MPPGEAAAGRGWTQDREPPRLKAGPDGLWWESTKGKMPRSVPRSRGPRNMELNCDAYRGTRRRCGLGGGRRAQSRGLDPLVPTRCGNITGSLWEKLSINRAALGVERERVKFAAMCWTRVRVHPDWKPETFSLSAPGRQYRLTIASDLPGLHLRDRRKSERRSETGAPIPAKPVHECESRSRMLGVHSLRGMR